MRHCIYPGTFDPMTLGHEDLVRRASRLFERLVLAVAAGHHKKTMFSVEERLDMLRETTAGLANVRVDSWQGLTVDYCRDNDIVAITKGLRSVSDFDYELQMAQMNHELSKVETLLMPNNPAYGFVSSSLVKEVATYGGDIEHLVPPVVFERLTKRLREKDS